MRKLLAILLIGCAIAGVGYVNGVLIRLHLEGTR